MNTPNVFRDYSESDGALSWDWSVHYMDFGYPLSVDGHIFRTKEISKLTKKVSFENPNTYEAALQMFSNFPKSKMWAYKESVLVNSPTNVVQEVYPNRKGEKHGVSAEELNYPDKTYRKNGIKDGQYVLRSSGGLNAKQKPRTDAEQQYNIDAEYYIDSKKETSNIRPVFSYCEHVKMKLFRLDSRMKFVNENVDIEKVKQVSLNAYNKTTRFNVEWRKWDFVIFDNNQCPHRRSEMAGDCHLHRLTSTFWLT